jgi:large subunit ribosomal protein L6
MITSRVGRKPVIIPAGVVIDVQNEVVTIKGPKGTLNVQLDPSVEISIEQNQLEVKNTTKSVYCRSGSGKRKQNAIPGTIRSNINNAVHGVTTGYERKLNLVGVGYRAQMKGKMLSLAIGCSHPVEFSPPEGVTIETPTLTEILIKGSSKYLVGHTASKIVAFKPQEPYKGKGIVNPRKLVVRKETKKK